MNRIYCSECGFLNTETVAGRECMSCLKGLSPKGMLKNLKTTIEYFACFTVRNGADSKAIKRDIEILEKNESTIMRVIQRIKKKDKEIRYLFQDDQITDLLKQVLKKDLTPEKIGLEKDLYKTRRGLAHLRHELKYAKDSSSTNRFKLLKERSGCTLIR